MRGDRYSRSGSSRFFLWSPTRTRRIRSTEATDCLPPVHMRRNAFDPTRNSARSGRHRASPRSSTRSACRSISSPGTRTSRRCCPITSTSPTPDRRDSSCPAHREMPEEEQASARAGNLLGLDPPEHQRLRRMLTPEFNFRRIKRLEPRITEIVDEHLDAMEAAGPPVDLVENFALPIPSLVICELLGVPYEDRADFQAQRTSARPLASDTGRMELQRAGREYMHSLVARARTPPRRGHSRHADPRTRRRAHRRRTRRRRGPAVARRPRDHVEHAGPRHPGAVASPRPARRRARRPGRRRPGRSRNCCAGCPSCRPRSRGSPPPTSRSRA